MGLWASQCGYPVPSKWRFEKLALSTDHAVNCLEHSRRSLLAEHCRTLLQHRHISKEDSPEQQDFKRLDRSGLANKTASQQRANWRKARATRSHAASPPAVKCELRRCASHFGDETRGMNATPIIADSRGDAPTTREYSYPYGQFIPSRATRQGRPHACSLGAITIAQSPAWKAAPPFCSWRLDQRRAPSTA